MHTPDNAPAINATELAHKRAELQAELNRIESLLNQCFKVSASECAALIGCRVSDVPARLETLRKDASFFRQVLAPVSLPKASEITPEAPALNPSTLKLGVFMQGPHHFATWSCPGIGEGSVLMEKGETLWGCFSRAMDEKRAQAARLTIEADRLKFFSCEAYNQFLAEGSK